MILGKTLMLGTGVSASKEYEDLSRVVKVALKNGILSFDTAPSYNTEELLGKILKDSLLEYGLNREDIFVQTKIDAWQMQEGNGYIHQYVKGAMQKMNIEYLDSLLVHWPIPEYLDNTWKSFIELRKEGIVKNIGICNVRVRHLNKMIENGCIPQMIQIERNPLNNCNKEVKFCEKHGILVQAYSPLCKMDSRIKDSKELNLLAEKYQKSVGQIVLRWHVDTGVIPIFTSRKTERIMEYANIFDFSLTQDDVEIISGLNINYKIYLESCICPGF